MLTGQKKVLGDSNSVWKEFTYEWAKAEGCTALTQREAWRQEIRAGMRTFKLGYNKKIQAHEEVG